MFYVFSFTPEYPYMQIVLFLCVFFFLLYNVFNLFLLKDVKIEKKLIKYFVVSEKLRTFALWKWNKY